jgi:hypothetical protein
MSIRATAVSTLLTSRASSIVASESGTSWPASEPSEFVRPSSTCGLPPRSATQLSASYERDQLASTIKRPGPGRRGPPPANPPWCSMTLRRAGCRRPACTQDLTRCSQGQSVARQYPGSLRQYPARAGGQSRAIRVSTRVTRHSWWLTGRHSHVSAPARGADPDPGPRLRHRGYEHWPTKEHYTGFENASSSVDCEALLMVAAGGVEYSRH